MSDPSPEPEGARGKPRGEAAWKAHREAIAKRNDRARAAGRRERLEREEREAMLRRAEESRIEAELASKLDPRYSN